MLGKTSSGPPALGVSRVGSGNMPIPSSLPPSSRIDSLSSSREPSSTQMELPPSRIEPPSVSQVYSSDCSIRGLLMLWILFQCIVKFANFSFSLNSTYELVLYIHSGLFSCILQSVFSDKGMGQVSNGLLMTPMTTVSVTNTPMTAVSMGYSSAGGTSRSGVSHSGPQSKRYCYSFKHFIPDTLELQDLCI